MIDYRKQKQKYFEECESRRLLAGDLVARWLADDLENSNSPLDAWVDSVAGVHATADGSPVLVSERFGDRAAVRFNDLDGRDQFRISKTESPVANGLEFGVVVAFAAAGEAGGLGEDWFSQSGIVGTNFGGMLNDWGVGIATGGQVVGGMGNGLFQSPTTLTAKDQNYIDDTFTIVAFTRAINEVALYIDGKLVDQNERAHPGVAHALDVMIGTFDNQAALDNVDVAEVRFYSGVLTHGDVTSITNEIRTYFDGARPVAAADRYYVLEGGQLIVDRASGVLQNDIDRDGDPLIAVLIESVANGKLRLGLDGSFRYVPTEDFFGSDFFQYRSFDSHSGSHVATVEIVVEPVNDAPVARPNAYFTALDQSFTVAFPGLLENDFDQENDELSAVLLTQPRHGAVELQSNGGFRYVPALGFRGRDTWTYQVFDGELYSEGGAVDVYVADSPVRISEVMSGNVASLSTRTREDADESYFGLVEFPDWIELGNVTDSTIDLGGFFLSDDADNSTRWRIPNGLMLEPNGYVVVYASGDSLEPTLDESGRWHTNFSLDMRGETVVLSFPDGRLADRMSLDEQYAGVSYGITETGDAYLRDATPDQANGVGFLGVVEPLAFSHERGFFDTPFTLDISTLTASSVVRYTTDGTEPSMENGSTYQGRLTIDTTTTLRARAFRDGFVPTASVSQTYLFPRDIIVQPDRPSDLPNRWSNAPADYGMDPDVVGENNLFEDRYRNTIIDDLKSLPTLSLVFDPQAMFGAQGIYQNPTREGAKWERATSVEFFDPWKKEDGFQINSGIRIMGGSSRQPDIPKHSFRLEFREQYGAGKLRYPLYSSQPYGDGATDTFDELMLRVGFNNSWMHRHYYQGERGEQPRDQWVRDLQFAMGHDSTRGRYTHVYLNGMYWGIYNLQERPAAPHLAEYFGGDADTDWDVLSSGLAINGSTSAWVNASRNARDVNEIETYVAYQRQVDLVNLADYMLLNFYVGNADWDGQNWYAARRVNGPFRFFAWDSEFAISLPPPNTAIGEDAEQQILLFNKSRQNSNLSPSGIHHQLRTRSQEYRLLFADRVQKHMFDGGVLTPARASELFVRRLEQIDRAVVAESARWGDYRRDVYPNIWPSQRFDLYTRDEHFVAQRDFILERYLPVRTSVVLGQLRQIGLYPSIAAPAFSQHGGRMQPGQQLRISAVKGKVLYTVDGTDPRELGGSRSAMAREYVAAIALDESSSIKARVFHNGEWSALVEADFTLTNAADSSSLRISELHYHPADATPTERQAGLTDAGRTEFIELTNISAAPIHLSEVRLASDIEGNGVDFSFADSGVTELGPGQSVVIVEDVAAFRVRYGEEPLVAGTWRGRLSNRSESITLMSGEDVIHRFMYEDGWHSTTDGEGPSLVPLWPAMDLDRWGQRSGWRPSVAAGGSPGEANAVPGDSNADGRFDSADLVAVFQRGEFEDSQTGNSTFAEGDWNGDGDFTVDDIVLVFVLGMYQTDAVEAVFGDESKGA